MERGRSSNSKEAIKSTGQVGGANWDHFHLSTLKNFRSKYRPSVEKGTASIDVQFQMAAIYAYLGGREGREDWIQYAFQSGARFGQMYNSDPRAKETVFLATVAAKQYQSAQKLFKELATSSQAKTYILASSEWSNWNGGKKSAARLQLVQILKKYPNSYVALEYYVQILMQSQDYLNAWKILKEMRKSEPDDIILKQRSVFTLSKLGKASFQNKAYDQAVEYYNSAFMIDPNDQTTRENLASSLIQAGYLKAAETHYHWLSKQDNPSASTFFHLARLEFNRKKNDLANEYLEKSLKVDKNYQPAKDFLKKLQTIDQEVPKIE